MEVFKNTRKPDDTLTALHGRDARGHLFVSMGVNLLHAALSLFFETAAANFQEKETYLLQLELEKRLLINAHAQLERLPVFFFKSSNFQVIRCTNWLKLS